MKLIDIFISMKTPGFASTFFNQGSAITWVLYCLAINPHIQVRIYIGNLLYGEPTLT